MRNKKIFTYKRMTRAAYLLGLVFLLTGMLLSMVSQPAAAGSNLLLATQPAIKPPPPRGPVTPPKPAPNVPALPGNPAPLPGVTINGARINSQAPVLSPNIRAPRVLGVVNGFGVEFTQQNYCLDQPEPGWVSAFVRVTLPEGATATLTTDWRVVHPNDLGELNQFHYSTPQTVSDGDVIEIEAWWPGNTAPGVSPGAEIHYGATIISGTLGTQTAGMDIYYNDGGCNARPALVLTAQCTATGVDWTVYNPAGAAYPTTFTYSLDGGPQTPGGTVPGGPGSLMFLTTNRQSHTVTITWEDLIGGSASTTTTSEPCGEIIPPLTFSHVCSANGGINFLVSNPGTTAVTFNYTVDGGAPASSTVPAGAVGTVFLNLSAGTAHTVVATWPDGQDGTGSATETSTAEECASTLIIVKECVELGLIRWSVYNPGVANVSFTWSFDGGLVTGNNNIGPGQTLQIHDSSGDAHTMLVNWEGGSDSESSVAGECHAPTPAELTLTKVCVENGIQWSVTNNGETAANFTWSLDSGADTGSGTVAAGATVVVTTTSGGAHLLTVTWEDGSVSLASVNEECAEVTPPVLTISKACYEDGGIQWTVHNDSDTAVSFTWTLDGGAHTGGGAVPANGSMNVIVSTGGAHTFSITWADGSASLVSTVEECGGERVPDLSVTWFCGDLEGNLSWRISNPGVDPVIFTWSLDGSAPVSATVVGGGSLVVATSTSASAHTIVITWPDGLGGEGTASSTSAAGVCQEEVTPTPTPDLTISYRCVDDRLQWTVRNPTNQPVSFEWDLDSGRQTGVGSVAANGSTAFLVSGNGRHTVVLNWPLPDPTRTLSRTSARDACVPTVETPPPSPTPFFPFITPTPGGPGSTSTPGGPGSTPSAGGTPGTPPQGGSTPGVPVTGATPMATVGAPGGAGSTGSGGQVLIPTTGADLTGFGFGLGMLHKLFTNLGLLFLGFALVLHGVSRVK